MPDAVPIVATPVLLLLQVPPEAASVKVVPEPIHTPLDAPDIADGDGITVTTAVAVQPVALTRYIMVVVPGMSAETLPDISIVATDAVVLVHVPPGVASANVTEDPVHTLNVPVTASTELTLIVAVI